MLNEYPYQTKLSDHFFKHYCNITYRKGDMVLLLSSELHKWFEEYGIPFTTAVETASIPKKEHDPITTYKDIWNIRFKYMINFKTQEHQTAFVLAWF